MCGWVSVEFPDDYKFMGLGGVLDCPRCHANLQNATLEGCYGHVTIITLEELLKLREQETHGIEWEQAFRLLQRSRLKLDKPVLLTTPFNTVPPEDDFNATMWEDDEDKLRKRKHKSIRVQGKYKGRGKTKRREP